MRVFAPLGVFAVLALSFNSAFAVKSIGTASVEIIAPAQISEVSEFTPVEFVMPLKVVNKVFKQYKTKIPTREYTIIHPDENSVQVSVKSAGNVGGVEVGEFVVTNGENNSRRTSFKLDGQLKVSGDAKPGIHEPRFQVAVYYE